MRIAWTSLVLFWAAPAFAQASLFTAAPGIAETSHRVSVELRDGLALVTTTMTFAQGMSGSAPIDVRLPVPDDAGLAGYDLCRGRLCRRGLPDPLANDLLLASSILTPSSPSGSAVLRHAGVPRAPAGSVSPADLRSMLRDGTQSLIDARVDPSPPGPALRVRVRYVARTRLEEGRVVFRLPPQHTGPVELRLIARGLIDPQIAEAQASGWQTVAGDEPITVSARLPRSLTSVHSVRCGDRRCVRYRVAAAAQPRAPRDLFLLLDVSPSVQVSREHRESAVRGFVAALPAGSTVRRVAFAWRARVLDPTPLEPDDLPTGAWLPTDLGPATRFESAWSLIRDEVLRSPRALLVIVGDGTLAWTPEGLAALTEVERAGVEISSIDLIGRPPYRALAAAIEQTRGGRRYFTRPSQDPSHLAELLDPLVDLSVTVGSQRFSPLRAGMELVMELATEGVPPVLTSSGRSVRARGAAGPLAIGLGVRLARSQGLVDTRETLSVLSRAELVRARKAAERRGRGAGLQARRLPRVPIIRMARAEVRGSVSREVIGRIRRNLRPAVGECFRRARRGRPGWEARVQLTLSLQHGEIMSSRVTHSTIADAALSRCVEEAPALLGPIPASDDDGVIVANLPFRSPPMIAPALARPLGDEARRSLEQIGVDGSTAWAP